MGEMLGKPGIITHFQLRLIAGNITNFKQHPQGNNSKNSKRQLFVSK
uniref:Uncharacterized protein MANES_02G128600 n=1 Tax=Rhizophora mucronata TaxID=61149 RepID=A0A2P2MNN5_RHIMU